MFTEVPFAMYKKHQHTLKECLLKAPLWLNTCLQRHESWMEPLENSVLSSTLNLEIIEKVKKKKLLPEKDKSEFAADFLPPTFSYSLATEIVECNALHSRVKDNQQFFKTDPVFQKKILLKRCRSSA